MKILIPFSLFLFVSACGHTQRDITRTKSSSAVKTSVHQYQCESGEVILTNYHSTDTASIFYKGSKYNLQIAVSGSGARYVGSQLEWWTKGSGVGSAGTLFRSKNDLTSSENIETCTQV